MCVLAVENRSSRNRNLEVTWSKKSNRKYIRIVGDALPFYNFRHLLLYLDFIDYRSNFYCIAFTVTRYFVLIKYFVLSILGILFFIFFVNILNMKSKYFIRLKISFHCMQQWKYQWTRNQIAAIIWRPFKRTPQDNHIIAHLPQLRV